MMHYGGGGGGGGGGCGGGGGGGGCGGCHGCKLMRADACIQRCIHICSRLTKHDVNTIVATQRLARTDVNVRGRKARSGQSPDSTYASVLQHKN
eukprot:2713130-Pleurochrysis_carterae.AAC.1